MRNLWPYLLLVTLLLVAALLLAACGALGAPAGAEPADSPTPTLAVPPAGEEAATLIAAPGTWPILRVHTLTNGAVTAPGLQTT